MSELPTWVREAPGGCTLAVKIQAKAGQDRLLKIEELHLKIQIQAPALEGKANAALIRFLQNFFNFLAQI